MKSQPTIRQADQLKTIDTAIGQELMYCTITHEQFTQSMGQFMPTDTIKVMLDY